MSLAERIAVVLIGCLLVGAVYVGAKAAVEPQSKTEPSGRPLDPHGLGFDAGVALRKGVDPLNPPGMPEGARIDPTSGLLSGVNLETTAGESVLDWGMLLPADKAKDAASLPEAITALDGGRVVVPGFLMPIYEMRDIRSFALVGSHYTCCFGTPPGLGGQILVSLGRGQGGLEPTVKPLWIRGTFRIREQHLHDDGSGPLVSLFVIVNARAGFLEY